MLEVNDGAGVFADCTLLEEADLSQTGITELEGTFEGCSALETVKLPENITKIGFGTFTWLQFTGENGFIPDFGYRNRR